MAIYRYTTDEDHGSPTTTTTTSNHPILYTTFAFAAVGLPLLATTAIAFCLSLTLLLISTPLLILFSPLLLPASLVLIASLTGLGLAGLTGLAGVCSLKKAFKAVGLGANEVGLERVRKTSMTLTESRQRVVEEESTGHKTVIVYPPAKDSVVS